MKKSFLLITIILFSSFALFGQLPNKNLQTLGSPINTLENSEFAPTVSADGNTMIFESDRGGGWKLFVSYQSKAGTWSKPEPLTAINNTIGPNDFLGGPCLSYDGKFLFYTSNKEGSVGGVDIWYSEKVGNTWSAPKNPGRTVNSAGYDGFPSLSPDGKYLYFMRAAEKTTSTGQRCCRIFRAEKRGKFFINPKPLPYPINTGCEGYPRIMADGKTLIFSSARNGGKGGYDLYESKFKNGKWSFPVAMDFINTPKDDELISVPASGDIIYLSSTMSNNKDDIYKIELPKEFRPDQVIALSGSIKNESNKVIQATVKVSNIKTKEKVVETENDPVTGNYTIYVEEGANYDFSITSKGHTFHSEVLKLDTLKKYEEFKKHVRLKPLKANTSFTLNNIFFEFDSSSLTKESELELERVLELLNTNTTMKVEISAHTDDRGSDEYNNVLSQARAESVVKYLTQKGIPLSRLIAKGYGKTSPSVPNTSEENRAKNRRVEFKILAI